MTKVLLTKEGRERAGKTIRIPYDSMVIDGNANVKFLWGKECVASMTNNIRLSNLDDTLTITNLEGVIHGDIIPC